MSKKRPSLVMDKKQRLTEAKEELSAEVEIAAVPQQKTVSQSLTRTSLSLEADLLYGVQEMALKRKKNGQKPDTVSGIMREALVAAVIESKLSPDKA